MLIPPTVQTKLFFTMSKIPLPLVLFADRTFNIAREARGDETGAQGRGIIVKNNARPTRTEVLGREDELRVVAPTKLANETRPQVTRELSPKKGSRSGQVITGRVVGKFPTEGDPLLGRSWGDRETPALWSRHKSQAVFNAPTQRHKIIDVLAAHELPYREPRASGSSLSNGLFSGSNSVWQYESTDCKTHGL